jgi:hypothetical protein
MRTRANEEFGMSELAPPPADDAAGAELADELAVAELADAATFPKSAEHLASTPDNAATTGLPQHEQLEQPAAAEEQVSAEEQPSAEPIAGRSSPVASALAELDTLAERELTEHPDVYQRIHSELQSALTAIDDA